MTKLLQVGHKDNRGPSRRLDPAQGAPPPVSQNGGMKHALIVAHPADRSFTASVAEVYRREVEAMGHQTIVRDLYRLGFDPCLKAGEIPSAEHFAPGPDVEAEREAIGDCHVFALFYPLWLNAPPAILKGYLDRVFGFGFAYGGEGRSFNPLLKGRCLISFTSSGAPAEWVEKTGSTDALSVLVDRYFAQLCGMSPMGRVHAGGIIPGASEFFIQARLNDIAKSVRANFGPIQTEKKA
jgi:NAD(P)H dehydrogenase (quinone)